MRDFLFKKYSSLSPQIGFLLWQFEENGLCPIQSLYFLWWPRQTNWRTLWLIYLNSQEAVCRTAPGSPVMWNTLAHNFYQVPSEQLVTKFCRAVKEFEEQRAGESDLLGVHCTHGLNRSVYSRHPIALLVCTYPILDKRISFLCPSVTLVLPHLDSETGWTWKLWSKTNPLK